MDRKPDVSMAAGFSKKLSDAVSREYPRPPLLVRGFPSGADGYPSDRPRPDPATAYFFYGSLMDASVLQHVVRSKERPILQPACIKGDYKIMMWGQYPALVDGQDQDSLVKGMVWNIQSLEEKVKKEIRRRLETYETYKYRGSRCSIEVDGAGESEKVHGATFTWAGKVDELREGSFDFRNWQMERLEEDLIRSHTSR